MTDPRQGIPESVLSSLPQARRMLGDQKALSALLSSPDAQALAALLQRQSGDTLRRAADAAGQGDTAPLQALVRSLLDSREGAQAAQRLQKDFSGR